MSKKTIILHVGHGKTGSSYLQSCFALNKEKLLDFGIDYPWHESFLQATSGKISSGNGDNFLKILPNLNSTSKKILFSNENLFHTLLVSSEFKDLLKSNSYFFKVILYTRNLFEFQFSVWQQQVKRHKLVDDLDAYLLKFPESQHVKIPQWLSLSEELNFKLLIRNYSCHKKNIADQFFFDLTGVENFPFELLPHQSVNRSLTHTETNFQRVLNTLHLEGPNLSDFLVNELPNAKASKIKCSRKTYDLVRSENLKLFESINKHLDSNEALVIESPERVTYSDENSKDFSLGRIEIDIIANYLSAHLMTQINAETDIIRDIAVKISKDRRYLKDALSLLKIAQRQRPNGPLIRDLVCKLEKKLN